MLTIAAVAPIWYMRKKKVFASVSLLVQFLLCLFLPFPPTCPKNKNKIAEFV